PKAELAAARLRLGLLDSAVGQNSTALKNYQQAVQLYESLPANAATERRLALAYNKFGMMRGNFRKAPEGLEACRTGLGLREKLLKGAGDDKTLRGEVGTTYTDLGHLSRLANKPAEAQKLYEQACAAQEPLVRDLPSAPRDLATAYQALATLHQEGGRSK